MFKNVLLFSSIVVILLFVVSTTQKVLAQTTSTTPTAAPTTTTTTLAPVTTTTAAPKEVDTSIVDLIFSFFAEDSDSINSYTVTIAQFLAVPQRRIDFYNVRAGDTTDPNLRTASNTPFGPNTMARVTIQPAFFTETSQEPSRSIRDRLVFAVRAKESALTGIFIIDAYPVNSTNIFVYNVRTVFDLMYTFIIATMGVAYIGFISFVIYKIIESHQYTKHERLNRQKEKEAKKIRREALRRAGKDDLDADEDDDENEQIDASKFDEFGGDGDDDEGGGGDYIRDEDGLAIRTLANDVAQVLAADDGEGGFGGPRFSSRRAANPAANAQSERMMRELNQLALPPPSEYASARRNPNQDDEL